jgi:hypothetical protein
MTSGGHVRFAHDGWRGWLDLAAGVAPGRLLARAAEAAGRRSRHAWTRALDGAERGLWLKVYPAPDGHRAARSWRMAERLRARALAAPETVLVATRARAGILVTRDVGGEALADAVTGAGRPAKRRLLHELGAAVARLHDAGFVHGDLVPPNVRVRDGAFVFLDHDRTRAGRALVWWGARRNLVQLGRFVVAGVGVTDRARVLAGYGAARGLARGERRALARWVMAKTIRRRSAIDGIPLDVAMRAGFAALMRSGGPFDPACAGGGGRT